MLENSLDAGATKINITVKDGGMRLLQIQDNGHGISRHDLPILCHRHTTSKLREFEDLATIATLGFRGEALSSISFVSHLSVTTRTADDAHGWSASFKDGEMSPEGPTPCAAEVGTTIAVEDLFYNVPSRKKSLKSGTEELNRILDVVGRYAIFKAGVAMHCRRQQEARADLITQAGAGRLDNIRAVYGATVAQACMPLQLQAGRWDGEQSDAEQLAFRLDGHVTKVTHAGKRSIMVMFINGRSVQFSALKRAMEEVYSQVPKKAARPFLFLDVRMPARHVDVNVHPTKSDVGMLHQDGFIRAVVEEVQRMLMAGFEERGFLRADVQRQLEQLHSSSQRGAAQPKRKPPSGQEGEAEDEEKEEEPGRTAAPPPPPSAGGTRRDKAGGDHKLVRTDAKAGSLDAFLTSSRASQNAAGLSQLAAAPRRRGASRDPRVPGTGGALLGIPQPVAGEAEAGRENDAPAAASQPGAPATGWKQRPNPPEAAPVPQLQQLLREVALSSHQQLTDIFRCYTWVGMADDMLALLQWQTKLYLVDMCALSYDLFYQQALNRFADPGSIALQERLSVHELAGMAVDSLKQTGAWMEEDGSGQEVASLIATLLQQKADLLEQGFGICISADGFLTALPALIDHYVPDLARLPELVWELGSKVEWELPLPCMRSIAQAVAHFYSLSSPSSPAESWAEHHRERIGLPTAPLGAGREENEQPAENSGDDDAPTQGELPQMRFGFREREWAVQHVLLPSMRQFLKPGQHRAKDGSVVQIAALEQLYRIFERC